LGAGGGGGLGGGEMLAVVFGQALRTPSSDLSLSTKVHLLPPGEKECTWLTLGKHRRCNRSPLLPWWEKGWG
jgi:hypothetical protein